MTSRAASACLLPDVTKNITFAKAFLYGITAILAMLETNTEIQNNANMKLVSSSWAMIKDKEFYLM